MSENHESSVARVKMRENPDCVVFVVRDCIDDNGVPNADAGQCIESLGGGFAELSPSGRDVHIWARGTLPEGAPRSIKLWGVNIEAYGNGHPMPATGAYINSDGRPVPPPLKLRAGQTNIDTFFWVLNAKETGDWSRPAPAACAAPSDENAVGTAAAMKDDGDGKEEASAAGGERDDASAEPCEAAKEGAGLPEPAAEPCNFLAPVKNGIPAEMRGRDNWVLWIDAVVKDSKGKERLTKCPVDASSASTRWRAAKSDDTSTWSSFETAWDCYEKHAGETVSCGGRRGKIRGVGFMFAPEAGIVGIDLDKCVKDGKLTSKAEEIVRSLGGLAEISPSDGGRHVYVLAEKPEGTRCRSGKVEAYASGRFFTVTGRWDGQPEGFCPDGLASGPEIQAALDALLAQMAKGPISLSDGAAKAEAPKPEAPAAEKAASAAPEKSTSTGERGGGRKKQAASIIASAVSEEAAREVFKRACTGPESEAFQRLFVDGDVAAYGGDESKADWAICKILAKHPDATAEDIVAIVGDSALMRDKWTRPDGTYGTYGRRTATNAIEEAKRELAANPLSEDGACGEPESEDGTGNAPAEAAEAPVPAKAEGGKSGGDAIAEEKVATACGLVLKAKTPAGVKSGLKSALKKLSGVIADKRVTKDYVMDRLLHAAIDAGLAEDKAVPVISDILDLDDHVPEPKTWERKERNSAPKKAAPAPETLPSIMDDPFGLGAEAVPEPDEALAKAAGFVAGLAAYENPEERLRDMAKILKFRGDVAADRILRELRASLKTAVAKAGSVLDFDTCRTAISVGIDAATKAAPSPISEEMREDIEDLGYLARNIREKRLPEDIIKLVTKFIERVPDAIAYPDAIVEAVTAGLAENKHLEGMKQKVRAAVAEACVDAAIGAMSRPSIEIPDEFEDFLRCMPSEIELATSRSKFFRGLRIGRGSTEYILCRAAGKLFVMPLRDWARCCLYSLVYVVEKQRSQGQWYDIDGEKRWNRMDDVSVKDRICGLLGSLNNARVGSEKYSSNVLAALRDAAKREETMSGRKGGAVRVACENGIVEMDGEGLPKFRPAELSDHVVTRVNARWHEKDDEEFVAALERMKAFMRSLFKFDEDCEQKMAATLEAIGSAMLQLAAETAWLFHGSGANGKGVLQRLITWLVGEENRVVMDLSQLGDPLARHNLIGKSVLLINECRVGAKFDIENFNKIVTGDEINGKAHYHDFVFFFPFATVIIFANHLPTASEDSNALMRRTRVISMNRTFIRADGSRDEDYSGDIDAELTKPIMMDALLRLAFEAVCAASRRGKGWEWTTPASSVGENAKLRAATSPLRTFMDERLVPDPAGFVPVSTAYMQYLVWSRDCSLKPLEAAVWRNELSSNVGVEMRPYKKSKVAYIAGYRLERIVVERNDRQDKTTPNTAVDGLIMSIEAFVDAGLYPAGLYTARKLRKMAREAVLEAGDGWVREALGDPSDEVMEAMEQSYKDRVVRDWIITNSRTCCGEALDAFDRKAMPDEKLEERKKRYAALAAKDGLLLASMPAVMRGDTGVCVEAVKQNPEAFDYVECDTGEAETAEEFVAQAGTKAEDAA